MKLIKILIILFNFTILSATVYENSEDGTTTRWIISDGNLSTTTVINRMDTLANNRYIELKGEEYASEYKIGDYPNGIADWNNTTQKYLNFRLRNSSGFLLDVLVNTNDGLRLLRYADVEGDLGVNDEYINFGLGYDIADGFWHKVTRDLEADLKKFAPNLELLKVSGILIRGDVDIDDIELLSTLPQKRDFVIYEDGEDNLTIGWQWESGTTVRNIFDKKHQSRAIELKADNVNADSYQYLYVLSGLNNKDNFNLKWDMKTQEGFIVDIVVSTTNGERLLRYNDTQQQDSSKDGEVLTHGLGYFSADGLWHTFVRDLEEDLKDLEPTNSLLEVVDFTVRMKGSIDNIELFTKPIKVLESAEDNSTLRWLNYSSNGGSVKNVFDATKKSRVIALGGNAYVNQYILGADYIGQLDSLNIKGYPNIKWSIKNSDGFVFTLIVNTQNGVRYINYGSGTSSSPTLDGDTLVYPLGTYASNGEWHTFIRNIEEDITKLEPTNRFLSIEGVLVTGAVFIDDLELFKILHPTKNRAGVAITFDDTTVDSWFNAKSLFDKYGAKATFFISHFYSLDQAQIDKLKLLEQSGFEIGCHTYNHKGVERDFHNDVNRIDEYINTQIKPAYDAMVAAGFNPKSFAYPYGEHDENYDSAVRAYFPYLRSTYDFFEEKIKNQRAVYHSSNKQYTYLSGRGTDDDYHDSMASIEEALIAARQRGEIITLFSHDIVDVQGKRYNISPKRLEKILEISKSIGLKFYTFEEAYKLK